MTQKLKQYCLNVEYDNGIDRDKDMRIMKIVGKLSGSSGCMFLSPHTRDMQFYFKVLKTRNEAKKRLMKAKIPGVRASAG